MERSLAFGFEAMLSRLPSSGLRSRSAWFHPGANLGWPPVSRPVATIADVSTRKPQRRRPNNMKITAAISAENRPQSNRIKKNNGVRSGPDRSVASCRCTPFPERCDGIPKSARKIAWPQSRDGHRGGLASPSPEYQTAMCKKNATPTQNQQMQHTQGTPRGVGAVSCQRTSTPRSKTAPNPVAVVFFRQKTFGKNSS